MIRQVLKSLWQASPQSVRLAAIRGICLLLAKRRVQSAACRGPVYVCGAYRSASGLAQSARLYVRQMEQQRSDTVAVDVTDAMLQTHDLPPFKAVMPLAEAKSIHGQGTVVIHANPPHFQIVLCKLGRKFLKNKRVVGFWLWELEAVPEIWLQALQYVDEVQVPSRFVQRTLQRHTAKPVSCHPYCLPAPAHPRPAGAKDSVVRCLYIFDGGSSFERKNPLAALQAFRNAFHPGEAELTFKISHASGRQVDAFLRACHAVPGVRVLTQPLTPEALERLYFSHDIYLSLHRSEGYGLTIREAMLRGLQIVATGWSGNMDFMAGDACHAVPYRLVPVHMPSGPYKGVAARWAEPDIDAAADILRGVRATLMERHAND